MKSPTLRIFIGSLILASLAACGGSGNGNVMSAEAPAPLAAPAAADAALPVASACNDPSCTTGADGLADLFRSASIERAAHDAGASQPSYPNVPSHAMPIAEARMPEALGTATLVRAN